MKAKFILAAMFLTLTCSHLSAQSLLKDLNPGAVSSNPESFITVNGVMYFVTTGGATYQHKIWKSDGTAAGTVVLKDSVITTNVGNVITLLNMNDTLYFVVNPNGNAYITNPASLWKSDGTTAGTVLIDSLVTASALNGTGDAQPRNYTVAGNKLFFQMGKGQGFELWVTDGSPGGVHQVVDLATGSSGAYQLGGLSAEPMAAYNGKVYFRGSNTGMGNDELYVSDGTAAGTVLVQDIHAGTGSSDPGSWIVYNNELYFSADNGSGSAIWKTDGTNTVSVAAGEFTTPVLFKNAMYFARGLDLWKSDGTSAGTVLVADSANSITGANTDYLFTSYLQTLPSAPYYELRYKRTDGTTAQAVSTNLGSSASFTVINNKMYAGTGSTGLWVTDGTEAGTAQLLAAPNIVSYAYAYNGTLFFSNWGTASGYELWSLTPGTSTGINPVNVPQSLSIYPNPVSGKLQFDCGEIPNSGIQTRIYDISGKVVRDETILINQLDVSELVNGFYILSLNTEGKVSTQKFVVQH
ncbi:MAG: hypothetical protein JWO03_2 [Bacteroidetes bacterium]|nr:hypothetical protein [Bacteroidota bacterium]